MITGTDIERAAREIFDRHGDNTVAVARERVAELAGAQDCRELDMALRILSVYERLVESPMNSDGGGAGRAECPKSFGGIKSYVPKN
jgi:hypothetical protein